MKSSTIVTFVFLLLICNLCKNITFAGTFQGTYTNKTSFIFAPDIEFENTRNPALIYIAADTDEPFMKIAIDHEIKTLKDTCSTRLSYWVVIIGSRILNQIMNDKEVTYQICNGGVLSDNVPFSNDIVNSIKSIYRRQAKQFPKINPLAIPEIYSVVLNETVTNIFDRTTFYYFIHSKAHGSKDHPIISLKSETIKSKTQAQLDRLKKEGKEHVFVQSINGELGNGHLESLFDTLNKTELEHLGSRRESEMSTGVEQLVASEKTFSQNQFENIFIKLHNDRVNIAFLFVESCSTPEPLAKDDLDPRWFRNEIPVSAYYMAKGYLGYHNLDWDEVFNSTNWITLTTQEMYQAIVRHLPFIKNRTIEESTSEKQLGFETDNLKDSKPQSMNHIQTIQNPIQNIYAGPDYTCVITKRSQRLVCWGSNDQGVLDRKNTGENSKTFIKSPILIDNSNSYSSVSLTSNIACGVSTAGLIKCWGGADLVRLGRSGSNSPIKPGPVPTAIESKDKFLKVSSSETRSCAINIQNMLTCWGNNWNDYLANTGNSIPVYLDSQHRYSDVAVSNDFACGLTLSGDLRCWASWKSDLFTSPYPIEFTTTTKHTQFTDISAGGNHICALSIKNQLYCLGDNTFGQIGGTNSYKKSISTLTPFLQVGPISKAFLGQTSTCILPSTNKRTISCWGKNADRFSILPQEFLNDPNDSIIELAIGSEHICMLTTRHLYCWGDNSKGQLAYEPSTDQLSAGTYFTSSPTAIKDDSKYKFVKAGNSNSCGITSSHKLKCWGANSNGQLGVGKSTKNTDLYNYSPNIVDPSEGYKSVAIGFSHICGLTLNGTVKCWGNNEQGQTGIYFSPNDSKIILNPTPVDPNTGYLKIAAAGDITCGLTISHQIKCWGKFDSLIALNQTDNTFGPEPIKIESDETFLDLSISSSYACAITNSKKMKCWGESSHIKPNTNNPIYTHYTRVPELIDPNENFLSISISESHGCGLNDSHQIKCWGSQKMKQVDQVSLELQHQTKQDKDTYDSKNLKFEDVTTGSFKTCGKIKGVHEGTYCWGSEIEKSKELKRLYLLENKDRPKDELNINTISLGNRHSCFIAESGTIFCWGNNEFGQLGIGELKTPFSRRN